MPARMVVPYGVSGAENRTPRLAESETPNPDPQRPTELRRPSPPGLGQRRRQRRCGTWLLAELSDGIDQTISHLKKLGMLNNPVTVAIDKHFIPRYDKADSPYLIKSRYKNGTIIFEGYGTIQCVDKSCRAQIGCTPIRKGDSKGVIVRKLLSDCHRNAIKTKHVFR